MGCEGEKFYDKEIAPELLRLGKLCQGKGLSLLAAVEWEPDEIGRTFCANKDTGQSILRANAILKGEDSGSSFMAITVTKGD